MCPRNGCTCTNILHTVPLNIKSSMHCPQGNQKQPCLQGRLVCTSQPYPKHYPQDCQQTHYNVPCFSNSQNLIKVITHCITKHIQNANFLVLIRSCTSLSSTYQRKNISSFTNSGKLYTIISTQELNIHPNLREPIQVPAFAMVQNTVIKIN